VQFVRRESKTARFVSVRSPANGDDCASLPAVLQDASMPNHVEMSDRRVILSDRTLLATIE
jgi:hypothetical protein